jgi:2-polyprenyl-3-methyl-5-hydroxy-6-metoxy-1,4-benzoquinol methylase
MSEDNIPIDIEPSKIQDPIVQEYCDLCGEQYAGRLYADCGDFSILSCNRCNLLWTNPLIRGAKAKPSPDFKADKYWAEDVYASKADAQKRRFSRQLRTTLKRAGIEDLKHIRVLEIGSGLGFFLDVCGEFGIQAEGCDITEKLVERANREGKRVRLGTLDEYYDTETYDALFAFNLIEHLIHPREFLIEARRVLKEGGILVLETPIRESLFHKVAKLSHSLSSGRVSFFGMSPGGHIYKFSRKAFEFICDDLEFKSVYFNKISSPFDEIWAKSAVVGRMNFRFLYRLSLPVVYTISKLTHQENRAFLILRK